MYKTINAIEMLETLSRGDKIYMVIPVEEQTTVGELNMAEAFVRVEPEGVRVETVISKATPETPEAPKAIQKKIDIGKLRALYRAGWEPKKIADELGCSVVSVRNYIKKIDEENEK